MEGNKHRNALSFIFHTYPSKYRHRCHSQLQSNTVLRLTLSVNECNTVLRLTLAVTEQYRTRTSRPQNRWLRTDDSNTPNVSENGREPKPREFPHIIIEFIFLYTDVNIIKYCNNIKNLIYFLFYKICGNRL